MSLDFSLLFFGTVGMLFTFGLVMREVVRAIPPVVKWVYRQRVELAQARKETLLLLDMVHKGMMSDEEVCRIRNERLDSTTGCVGD